MKCLSATALPRVLGTISISSSLLLNKGYSNALESENYVFFEKSGTKYSKENRAVLKLEKKTGIVEEII